MEPTSHGFSLRKLFNDFGERRSERRLMKVMGRLEETKTEPERLKAFEQLTDLLSKDPRALRSYMGHRELEMLLSTLQNDPDYLPS